MNILSKSEKKELIIKLYKDGKNYQEIAKTVRISPRDIGKIINGYTEEKTNINHIKSVRIKGYELLRAGLSPIDVAIKLRLPFEEIKKIYLESLVLQGLHNVEKIYVKYEAYMPEILEIIDTIERGEISSEEFKKFCKYIRDIPGLERRWFEKLQWDKFMSKRDDSSDKV